MKEVFIELMNQIDNGDFDRYWEQEAENKRKVDEFYDRWTEKLHNMPVDYKKAVLKKVQEKYCSDGYCRRYYKRGFEPDEELYYLAYKYAERYGEEYDPGYTAFVSSSRIVDGEFIVLRLDGQGTFFKVMTKADGDVEIERCRKLDEDMNDNNESFLL